jgi:hypothetical protein
MTLPKMHIHPIQGKAQARLSRRFGPSKGLPMPVKLGSGPTLTLAECAPSLAIAAGR